jgi:hypothetical protein
VSGLSFVDLFGVTLSGYWADDQKVFDQHIRLVFPAGLFESIEIAYARADLPYARARIAGTNVTIAGLRGFDSGTELAAQVGLVADHARPLLTSFAPVYDQMRTLFLGSSVSMIEAAASFIVDPAGAGDGLFRVFPR